MNIYTLYVKTHNITGLKYLGQTKQDPSTYLGSGVDWRLHLKTHGHSVTTEILFQSTNKNEVIQQGKYFSNKWNILSSQDNYGNRIWANRIIENGSGAGRIPGSKHKQSTKDLIAEKATGRKQSEETKAKRRGPRPNFSPWNKGINTIDLYSKEERKKKFGSPGKQNPMFGKTVPIKTCPHCSKQVDIRNYSRYHGSNCKLA